MPLPLAIPAGAALAKLAVGAGATAALGSKVYQSVKGKQEKDLKSALDKIKNATPEQREQIKKDIEAGKKRRTHIIPASDLKTKPKQKAKDIIKEGEKEDKRFQEKMKALEEVTRAFDEGGKLIELVNSYRVV